MPPGWIVITTPGERGRGYVEQLAQAPLERGFTRFVTWIGRSDSMNERLRHRSRRPPPTNERALSTPPVPPNQPESSPRVRVHRRRAWRLPTHRSERRFRAAFEQATVGMVFVDLTGRVVRANPHCSHILGYEP